MLIIWSSRSPRLIWLLNLERFSFLSTWSNLFETRLFGVHFWRYHYTPLEYRCLIKISNWIWHVHFVTCTEIAREIPHVTFKIQMYPNKYCILLRTSNFVVDINVFQLYTIAFLDKEKPIFEWCFLRDGCKDQHPKLIFLEKIGFHAQILLIILGSIINIMGRGGGT